MAIDNINTFPYSEDATVAPYSDGLLASDPVTSVFMPPLGSSSSTPQSVHKLSGQVVKGYVGSTDMIFATKIWYPQNAGDS
jgi:hypothetical protein